MQQRESSSSLLLDTIATALDSVSSLSITTTIHDDLQEESYASFGASEQERKTGMIHSNSSTSSGSNGSNGNISNNVSIAITGGGNNSSSDEEEVIVRRTNLKKKPLSRSSSTSPIHDVVADDSNNNIKKTMTIVTKSNLLSVSNHDEEAGFTCPSLSNSPPSGALSPMKTRLISSSASSDNNGGSGGGDIRCTTRWIDCLMVATFDIELGQKIHQVYPSDYPISQSQLSDIAYLSFPDGNNQTSTTGATSEKPTTCTWAFRTSDDLFGYVHFLQQQDSTVKRGCLMTSVILLTKYPFIKLYRYMIQKIAMNYFSAVEKQKKSSESAAVLNASNVFAQVMKQVNNWVFPEVDSQYELSFFEQKIKYRSPLFIPSSQSYQNKINQLKPREGGGVSSVTPLKERLLGRKYPYQQEVNVYRNFISHNLETLAKFWELVITGEPILVLSPTPTQCCVSVFSLVSIIAPIPYGGDVRPYFTVHNQDFKYFSQMGGHQGFTSAIVGVTNPFFVKAYENWPHIITVGKQHNSSVVKKPTPTSTFQSTFTNNKLVSFFTNIDNESNERKQLMWDYKETFLSKKKSFIVDDLDISGVKLLTEDINISDRSSADSLNNDQIRKFFEQLTEDFLHPIHQCFDTLVCSMKTFIVRSEHAKVFKTEKFINYIKKNGYNEKVFKAKKSDVFEMYKRFIYSTNFKSFMEHRLREAYVNDVQHTDIDEFLKNEKFSEIDLIDLFLQIKQDLVEEMKTYDDDVIVTRLQIFLSQILKRLPDTLKLHLERQLNSMVEDLKDSF